MSEVEGAWERLPQELLEVIGSRLSHERHWLAAARTVCRQWRYAVPAGLSSLEVDMHPDPAWWEQKLASLVKLVRHLVKMTLFVSATVPYPWLAFNMAALRQLPNLKELDVILPEGYELTKDAAAALGKQANLQRLCIKGGTLAHGAAQQLLTALKDSTSLEHLSILPDTRCGLGDADMDLLIQLASLRVLEFRACRLSNAGMALLRGLPCVERLAIYSLDSESGYDMDYLGAMTKLEDLDLGLDHVLRSRPINHLTPAQKLSLKFRWTDRVSGLLAACSACALRSTLTRLDLGACRLTQPGLFSAVAHLGGLRDLKMSVYSNADDVVCCDLSLLAALSALQVFQLTKQHAYFPEQRRFMESSITVPVTRPTISSLVPGWQNLTHLKLALSRTDYTKEGLAALGAFTGLKSLILSVEHYHQSQADQAACDVLALPPQLTALELSNLRLEFTPAALAASRVHLRNLQRLDLDACHLRTNQLTALALRLSGQDLTHPDQASDSGAGSSCLEAAAESDAGAQVAVAETAALVAAALPGASEAAAPPSTTAAAPLFNATAGLHYLRLFNVAGLTNDGLAALSHLTSLHSLAVVAPRNDAVSQDALLSLTPLADLRYLTWQSDDLTALGPSLPAFTTFTSLRLLSLSCTSRTFVKALGCADALRPYLPYCYVDTIKSNLED